METEEQLLKLLIWMAFGMGCGIWIDAYRAWSQNLCRAEKILGADCISWCIFALSVFLFSLYLREGEMRLYFLLGLGGGYVLYRRMFGDRVMRAWKGMIAMTRHLMQWSYRIMCAMVMPIGFLAHRAVRMKRNFERWFAKRSDLPPSEKR